jgi:putative (di)nucleoside polyphosphate hydrolase
MNPSRDAMPYRDCVGIALFNADGRVFIARRAPDGTEDRSEFFNPWQMPQGGLDMGEEPYAAALRELYEETSIRAVSPLAEAPDWVTYDLPDEVLGVALKGKYRGQRQKWFALRFEGPENEIDVLHPAKGQHPAEFNAWRWEDLEVVPDLVVPFKRPAYEQIVTAFRDIPKRVRGS